MGEISYCNTDLDLHGTEEIQQLIPALTYEDGEHTLCALNHFQQEDGTWLLTLEGASYVTPEMCACMMLRKIESLTEEPLAVWRRCTQRIFNLGYMSGESPRYLIHDLSHETISRMAALGISLKITIYASAGGAAVKAGSGGKSGLPKKGRGRGSRKA